MEDKATVGKKAYEKPAIRTIELVADEVLASGCKTLTSIAAGSQPQCGHNVGCSLVGS